MGNKKTLQDKSGRQKEPTRDQLPLVQYPYVRGGIFTTKKRLQIKEPKRLAGRGKSVKDFWYDVRKTVGYGLKDLELFIDHASDENVNRVITVEALRPIVHGLFYRPLVYEKAPDRDRAVLAHDFVRMGFEYLQRNSIDYPEKDEHVKKAVGLALFLANHLERGKK